MIVILISLMCSFFFVNPASAKLDSAAKEQIVEGIAAIVTTNLTREANRELIFYSDLEIYRLFFSPSPHEERSNLTQRLNQVIEQHLLRPEARRFILEEPSDETVKERLKIIRQSFSSETLFEDALRQTGLIEKELESEIREHLWVEQLLDERIKGFIFISPKTIEDYFYEHPDLFAGRALPEVSEQIEQFLITKKEAVKKTEYLRRIREKAEIKILLK